MSDLLERLRRSTVNSERVIFPAECDPVDVERREAADEIERLQAELADAESRAASGSVLKVLALQDEIARLQAMLNAVRSKCYHFSNTFDAISAEAEIAIIRILDGEVKHE